MSKENLVNMLKNLCEYNDVHIEHTFSINNQPQITVKCVKDTYRIEIIYLDSQTVKLFDNIEEAAVTIHQILNVNSTS